MVEVALELGHVGGLHLRILAALPATKTAAEGVVEEKSDRHQNKFYGIPQALATASLLLAGLAGVMLFAWKAII